MKIPSMFASDALFQAESELSVFGETTSLSCVKVILKKGDYVVFENETTADESGKFSLTITTPKASFDKYSMTIAGDETIVMENVLFGELWLASGQSNMELMNFMIPEHELLYDAIADKDIRFFHVDYQGLLDAEMKSPFPCEPQPFGDGMWVTSTNRDALSNVSALATKFAQVVFSELNKDKNVPFGILDASWGGTPITAWLKRSDIDSDQKYAERLKNIGKYPAEETWNTNTPCLNFQQTTAQYNVKIAPLVGAKVRGIIWYQGEHETAGEFYERSYLESLRFYHKTYTERFALDKNNFLMISSLLHYWTYGEEGECKIGDTNNAFITAAASEPSEFAYASNGDLAPVWAQHLLNHPIHPVHKYPLGERMAHIALANVYGKDFKKAPATLESVEEKDGSLVLIFKDADEGLRIGQGDYYAPGCTDGFRPVRTLYIAGENRIYMPASAKITGKNVLEVRCDGISSPKYVAYNIQSIEPGANLMCGEYPVTPFFTQTDAPIHIESRPWYDMNNESCWALKNPDLIDLFYHPVWFAMNGSEVCTDSAFRYETDKSIRICRDDDNTSEYPVIGAFVRSYPYMQLDLANFSRLEMNLLCGSGFKAELVLRSAEGEIVCPFTKVSDIAAGFARMSADISGVTSSNITRMTFRFTPIDPNPSYCFVNIEKIRLFV